MLPHVTLTLRLHQQQPLDLPEHAGSLLRGVFGHALRDLVCSTRQSSCNGCPLVRHCVYTQVFDFEKAAAPARALTQQAVNPYVLTPPRMGQRRVPAGASWDFGFTVFGQAMDRLPLLEHAWQQAAAAGLGKSRSRARLQRVNTQRTAITVPNGAHAHAAPPTPINPPRLGESVRLRFLTPVRIQQQGHVVLVPEQLSAEALLMSLAHRVQALAEQHTPQPVQLDLASLREQSRLIRIDTGGLRRHGVQRFSSRQQQVIALDGLIGEVRLSGDLQPFAELLAIGQHTHVGKNATHGLGCYQLMV